MLKLLMINITQWNGGRGYGPSKSENLSFNDDL